MLRELKKGEKVLVIKKCRNSEAKVGEILTVVAHNPEWCNCEISPNSPRTLKRGDLLAIGDKVVRGPDWEGYGDQDGGIGGIGKISHIMNDRGGQTVRVLWDNPGDPGSNPFYIMNADYQDLKPTGDSEEGEEQKEYSDDPYRKQDNKPIQEDTMTREQRAKEEDKKVKSIHEQNDRLVEEIAQNDERIKEHEAEAKSLRLHKTDKEANMALVIKAKNLDGKVTPEEQAEAMLILAEKEIKV